MSWWDWLNGKKLVIGGILFIASDVLVKVIFPHLTATPEWLKMIQELLSYGADAFAGVGLIHKGVKAVQ